MTSVVHNHTLLLDAEGRLVLPDIVRQQLGLIEGDRFILTVSANGVLQLVSLKQQVQSLRGFLKNPNPQTSVVEELIQDRRRSAASE